VTGYVVEVTVARSSYQYRQAQTPPAHRATEGVRMSEYLILIYENEQSFPGADDAAWGEIMAGHQKFGENNATALRGGNALQPTATATSIRGTGNGEFTVTDGPFAETKEALGGYYLVEAADLDEAIAIAKQVPAAYGSVEVRPIMTFS
jgi:hypothetical protein